ncbi:hypothetical protein MFE_02500 [Mycoplasmopsis fermentans JER]|nr:hypothetical protein MFE_02500 [Mycoplasmopsis fermentans JER]
MKLINFSFFKGIYQKHYKTALLDKSGINCENFMWNNYVKITFFVTKNNIIL